MKIMTRSVSAGKLPAKAQDIDDIFQFLFNVFDLLTLVVEFIAALVELFGSDTPA